MASEEMLFKELDDESWTTDSNSNTVPPIMYFPLNKNWL